MILQLHWVKKYGRFDRRAVGHKEQLAEYADLHVSYIVLLEKGANRATIETLEKLAKAFCISISDLVHALDDAQDDPIQKQMRELMGGFHSKN